MSANLKLIYEQARDCKAPASNDTKRTLLELNMSIAAYRGLEGFERLRSVDQMRAIQGVFYSSFLADRFRAERRQILDASAVISARIAAMDQVAPPSKLKAALKLVHQY